MRADEWICFAKEDRLTKDFQDRYTPRFWFDTAFSTKNENARKSNHNYEDNLFPVWDDKKNNNSDRYSLRRRVKAPKTAISITRSAKSKSCQTDVDDDITAFLTIEFIAVEMRFDMSMLKRCDVLLNASHHVMQGKHNHNSTGPDSFLNPRPLTLLWSFTVSQIRFKIDFPTIE